SAIFDNSGAVVEWIKYSAYGVPFLLTPGDHGKDGGISAADQTAFNADYAANNLRADLNKDGTISSADQTLFTASYNKGAVGGRWKLSAADVCNRKGYAGYEHEGFGNDLAAPEIAHVRHRVLHFGLGRYISLRSMVPAAYVTTSAFYSLHNATCTPKPRRSETHVTHDGRGSYGQRAAIGTDCGPGCLFDPVLQICVSIYDSPHTDLIIEACTSFHLYLSCMNCCKTVTDLHATACISPRRLATCIAQGIPYPTCYDAEKARCQAEASHIRHSCELACWNAP
ncbi:MAG: hypothetical protein KF743_14265, partial [Fimbriimonadaceae bacterium]|nr:hypothetical protein [Fimbriimonadaceae bacterium]